MKIKGYFLLSFLSNIIGQIMCIVYRHKVTTNSDTNTKIDYSTKPFNKTILDCFGEYDIFTWIPSSSGNLFLDIAGDNNNILGDVDKHFMVIDSLEEQPSKCLAFSSLLTITNTFKSGRNYIRTYRYIVVGTINSDIYNYKLFKGKICVIIDDQTKLSANVNHILNSFLQFAQQKSKFQNLFISDLDFATLAKIREKNYSIWKSIKDTISYIKENEERTNYFLDFILSQDGLLFVKYDKESRFDLFNTEEETETNPNTIINRVFRHAVSYIRHPFYVDYYQGTYYQAPLIISNLHYLTYSVGAWGKTTFVNVLQHQLDALLSPVRKMKYSHSPNIYLRNNFLYANTLIDVFVHNGLIDKDKGNQEKHYLETQRQEYENATEAKRVEMKASIESHDPLNLASNRSTIIACAIAFFALFFNNSIILNCLRDTIKYFIKHWNITTFLIIGLVIFVSFINALRINRRKREDHTFQVKNKSFFFKDSNIQKMRLSFRYSLWIEWTRIPLMWRLIIPPFFYLLLLIISIYMMYILLLGLF